MKDKLTHEVEILGRSVSVLLLAGLIMAAGASAALLDSFGTVDGDASVNQSITVNGISADSSETDAFSQSWSFEGVVAGESTSSVNTISNNLDSAHTVHFDSTEDNAPSGENSNDQTAYSAGHLILENGETFENVESKIGQTGEPGDSLEASADYVYSDSQAAVKASFEAPEQGHVHSGLWFDVEETDYENAVVEVEVDDSAGNYGGPDWIYVVASDSEGNAYILGDWSFKSTPATFDVSGDYASVYQAVEDGTNPDSSLVDISDIDSRSDFDKAEFGDDLPSDLTIHYAVTATGTNAQNGPRPPVVYTDFSFGDAQSTESLMQTADFASDEPVEVPSGTSDFGTAIDFDIAAYPGDYTYTLNVNPESEN